MKKKIIIIVIVVILAFIICAGGIIGLTLFAFDSQYNSHGVSHFLVVTIDNNQEREYLGELDGYGIYIEGFNIKETNFRNMDAENVSIKEAIEKNLTSVDEWRKRAFRTKKENDKEILIYDNYEIVIIKNDCIIRPKK